MKTISEKWECVIEGGIIYRLDRFWCVDGPNGSHASYQIRIDGLSHDHFCAMNDYLSPVDRLDGVYARRLRPCPGAIDVGLAFRQLDGAIARGGWESLHAYFPDRALWLRRFSLLAENCRRHACVASDDCLDVSIFEMRVLINQESSPPISWTYKSKESHLRGNTSGGDTVHFTRDTFEKREKPTTHCRGMAVIADSEPMTRAVALMKELASHYEVPLNQDMSVSFDLDRPTTDKVRLRSYKINCTADTSPRWGKVTCKLDGTYDRDRLSRKELAMEEGSWGRNMQRMMDDIYSRADNLFAAFFGGENVQELAAIVTKQA